jgi:flagellar M-ring protein FliF
MEFQPVEVQGTVATASMLDRVDLTLLAQIGLLSIVALALGLFVVRPILTRREGAPMLELASAPHSGGDASLPAPAENTTAGGGARAGKVVSPTVELVSNTPFDGETGQPASALTSDEQDPVARLRRMIRERQSETVEVLRTWMEDEKEKV